MMLSDEEMPPHDETKTPLAKIRAQLEPFQQDDGTYDDKEYAILVSTGSYSPVHRMHMQIFEIARKTLLESGYTVIGGFISPSHNQHVFAKLGNEFLPAGLRIEFCNMACSSSDWVSVSQWEATCAGFVDFPRVTRSISEFVKLETKIPRLTPFYICGSDLIIRCRLYHGARQFGVVGVSRPGWKPNEQVAEIIEEAIKDQANRRFYLVEGDSVDVSSTKIREHLANNDLDALKQLTYPDVAEALLTRDLRAIRHEALQAWPDFGHNLSLSPTALSSKWKKQEPKSRGACAIM